MAVRTDSIKNIFETTDPEAQALLKECLEVIQKAFVFDPIFTVYGINAPTSVQLDAILKQSDYSAGSLLDVMDGLYNINPGLTLFEYEILGVAVLMILAELENTKPNIDRFPKRLQRLAENFEM